MRHAAKILKSASVDCPCYSSNDFRSRVVFRRPLAYFCTFTSPFCTVMHHVSRGLLLPTQLQDFQGSRQLALVQIIVCCHDVVVLEAEVNSLTDGAGAIISGSTHFSLWQARAHVQHSSHMQRDRLPRRLIKSEK